MDLILIPGGFETTEFARYDHLKKFCKDNKISLHIAPIDWKHHTFTERQKQFLEWYHTHSFKDPVLMGFSRGGMIAVITANIVKPKHLIVCGLSPYRAEDIMSLRQWRRKAIGIRRLRDFLRYKFNALESIDIPTTITYGGDEYETVVDRCKVAHKAIAHSKLIVLPGVGHDIPNTQTLTHIRTNITR